MSDEAENKREQIANYLRSVIFLFNRINDLCDCAQIEKMISDCNNNVFDVPLIKKQMDFVLSLKEHCLTGKELSELLDYFSKCSSEEDQEKSYNIGLTSGRDSYRLDIIRFIQNKASEAFVNNNDEKAILYRKLANEIQNIK